MTFRVRIAPLAQRGIDDFADYLRDYSQEFAFDQIKRLDRIFGTALAESPLTWAHFPLTGAPYRGYLFRVGRRTQYWLIYRVDEGAKIVDVLHFWNTARDPEELEL